MMNEDVDKKVWEQFELITSAHGGTQMYFLKDDRKTVYSRWSHRYMTFDEALDEFLDMIGDSQNDD